MATEPTPVPATPRVVVCGTSFGRVYLRAVQADPDVELAGIVSRGSATSREIAKTSGVPHYCGVDELPGDIDIACVAVRAGAAGGDGAQLAQQLLRRGIHVLQEHLLHPGELADCLRTARAHDARYRLNAFYPHLRPVELFLRAAAILRARQRPLHVDAAAGGQVAYSLLDIVGRAVGKLRPWAIGEPAPVAPEPAALADPPMPYTHLAAVIGGVPVSLRVQNQIHPADPDNHALLLHRIAIAFEGGVLSLADTHGPVLWSPRLHTGQVRPVPAPTASTSCRTSPSVRMSASSGAEPAISAVAALMPSSRTSTSSRLAARSSMVTAIAAAIRSVCAMSRGRAASSWSTMLWRRSTAPPLTKVASMAMVSST
ncbi:Gfo/Idh/MocA family oxidoreductase [Nocardia farcinica]|nr:Gfo/Idh/MocA family oxidoreductase [Nocardia farcinica]